MMNLSSFESFTKQAATGSVLSVWTKLPGDTLTPIRILLRLVEDNKPCFLFESLSSGDRWWGRYSFIGFDPMVMLRSDTSNGINQSSDLNKRITEALQRYRSAEISDVPRSMPRLRVGLVGFSGLAGFDIATDTHPSKSSVIQIPDYIYFMPSVLIAFDNVTQKMWVIKNVHVNDPTRPMALLRKIYHEAQEELYTLVNRLHETEQDHGQVIEYPGDENKNIPLHTVEPEIGQLNISETDLHSLTLFKIHQKRTCATGLDLYRALRTTLPSRYMYYFNFGDFEMAGSSPEVLFRVEGNTIITNPTTVIYAPEYQYQSAQTPSAFTQLHQDMVQSSIQPLSSLVDEVSVYASSTEFESHRGWHGLTTSIRSKMKPGKTAVDVHTKVAPSEGMIGTPRQKAIRFIREFEHVDRNPFGGCVGYFEGIENADMCSLIRTFVVVEGTATFATPILLTTDEFHEIDMLYELNQMITVLARAEQINQFTRSHS